MLLYHTIVLCLTIATITIIYTTTTTTPAVTSISTTTTIIGIIVTVSVVHMVGGRRRRYGMVVGMTTEYGGTGVTYDTLRLTIRS